MPYQISGTFIDVTGQPLVDLDFGGDLSANRSIRSKGNHLAQQSL